MPHPHFSRAGDDLHLNLTVPLVDALVGFTKQAGRRWVGQREGGWVAGWRGGGVACAQRRASLGRRPCAGRRALRPTSTPPPHLPRPPTQPRPAPHPPPQIEHLDGHKVTVANAGVTKPGDVLRVVGEGMPLPADPHKRGDLHVLVTVGFPATLSDAQKAVVREHFRPAKDEL